MKLSAPAILAEFPPFGTRREIKDPIEESTLFLHIYHGMPVQGEKMPVAETFRVNYYVGAVLAQGGNLSFEGTKIIFSPTSAIDRAMGARDVEIPFREIRAASYAGALSRTVRVKTDDKVHKFEGGQAKQIWELLKNALQKLGTMPPDKKPNKTTDASAQSFFSAEPPARPQPASPPQPSSSLSCDQCEKPLQAGYSFCPYCGNRLKAVCSSCHRTLDPSWSACAYCGLKSTVIIP